MKKFIFSLVAISLMTGCSLKSFAAGTAVVDLDKIRDNYSVAQELAADHKVKEVELQKFLYEAQKQIEAAKTPLEKKNLQEKFLAQFNIKKEAYEKDEAEKWVAIDDSLISTVKEISSAKKFDIVFNKQVVIIGGCDITEDVLAKLNNSVKTSEKSPEPKK